jgi:CRISPR/Cas system-associated exonuclease Cas4 (RecB family)
MPTFLDALTGRYKNDTSPSRNNQLEISNRNTAINKPIHIEPNITKPDEKVTILSFGKKSVERHYIAEFNQAMIRSQVESYLSYKVKDYISVSVAIKCPLETWLIHTESVTSNNIDYDKVFSLLDLYAAMGNTVHQYVYDTIPIENADKITLVDNNLKIRGRPDIVENGVLVDIKSARKEQDHSAQLSLYYYLCSVNNIFIKEAKIWYVLLNREVSYPIKRLESIYPTYLKNAEILWNSIHTNNPPPPTSDKSDCEYCLLTNYCREKFIK